MKWNLSKGRLWSYLIRPYKDLLHGKNFSALVLWFVFTIFAAQIGTLINIIKHGIFHDGKIRPPDFNLWRSIGESIYLDSKSGSFYTFAIVLVASVLSPLFIQLLDESELHFKKMKIFTIVISIFTLFFGGVFYSFSTLRTDVYDTLRHVEFAWDKSQTFFFVFSIMVASYAFALTRMNRERNKDIDDYISDQNGRREKLQETGDIDSIDDDIKVK